jgi:hypothetical protein
MISELHFLDPRVSEFNVHVYVFDLSNMTNMAQKSANVTAAPKKSDHLTNHASAQGLICAYFWRVSFKQISLLSCIKLSRIIDNRQLQGRSSIGLNHCLQCCVLATSTMSAATRSTSFSLSAIADISISGFSHRHIARTSCSRLPV